MSSAGRWRSVRALGFRRVHTSVFGSLAEEAFERAGPVADHLNAHVEVPGGLAQLPPRAPNQFISLRMKFT